MLFRSLFKTIILLNLLAIFSTCSGSGTKSSQTAPSSPKKICEQLTPEQCYKKGEKTYKKDQDKGFEILLASCNLDYQVGCTAVAGISRQILMSSKIKQTKRNLNLQILRKLCLQKNHPLSCSLYYENLEDKKETDTEIMSGFNQYMSSCQKGDTLSCYLVYDKIIRKHPQFLKRNFSSEEIANFTEKICKAGIGHSCFLSAFTHKKKGRNKKEMNLYVQGCQKQSKDCCNQALASIFLSVYKGDNNYKDMDKPLDKMCQNNYLPACYLLAHGHFMKYWKNSNPKTGFEIAKYSCFKGNQKSCLLLAKVHYFDYGYKKNHKLARNLALKSCTHGYSSGCTFLAEFYRREKKKDLKQITNLLRDNCVITINKNKNKHYNSRLYSRNHPLYRRGRKYRRRSKTLYNNACGLLGYYWLKSNEEPQNFPITSRSDYYIKNYLKNSCNKYKKINCFYYGKYLEYKDEKPLKIIGVYDKACKSGIAQACFRLSQLFASSKNKTIHNKNKAANLKEIACRLNPHLKQCK
jgi:TPR repeat protein